MAVKDSEREQLIVQYLPLVRSVAWRFASAGAELEDLVQVGTIGLIKAVDRFDPARGVDFAAYARPTVTGEIQRHLRDAVPTVRPPRRLHELSGRLRRLRRELGGRLGRPVTLTELAQAAGTSEAEAGEAEALEGARSPLTLDAALGGVDPYRASDDRMLVASCLDALPRRERRILELRFYEGLTQREIARTLGLSQIHVSRLIASSLETLRAELDSAQPKRPVSAIVLPVPKPYTGSHGAASGETRRGREAGVQRPVAAAYAARAAR